MSFQDLQYLLFCRLHHGMDHDYVIFISNLFSDAFVILCIQFLSLHFFILSQKYSEEIENRAG